MPNEQIISLIGMPGSGKSTVGSILARRLGLGLVDTDMLIESREDQILQEIVDSRGYEIFRCIEESVVMDMPLFPSVIATGGSVVYSRSIMTRLKTSTTIIYLKAGYDVIEYRVSLSPQRGIASSRRQTLKDIYYERLPLYDRYGEIVVDCSANTPEMVATEIENRLRKRRVETPDRRDSSLKNR